MEKTPPPSPTEGEGVMVSLHSEYNSVFLNIVFMSNPWMQLFYFS